jgi:DNA-entry nuclease
MKIRHSLVIMLALLLIVCTFLTGCQSVAVSSADADVDGEVALDEVEEYGFWSSWFGYSRTTTAKATTAKATTAKTTTAKATTAKTTTVKATSATKSGATLASVMKYTGKASAVVNNNKPEFSSSDITTKAYEFYSPLDSKGRCGYAMACVGKELMPTGSRGSISSVKPTGWVQNTYAKSIISTQSLYNRCHLIGWQLSAENANKQNLITGTRFMNNEGMLPFENMIADYIKDTGNHVMYRVTPMFDGNNLVASGVHLEAYSVEDEGEGICVNVFLYNVQEGIIIDYATGENKLATPPVEDSGETNPDVGDENVGGDNNDGGDDVGGGDNSDTSEGQTTYILNINPRSKKIHYPDCTSVRDMSEANKQVYTGPLSDIIAEGYTPCGRFLKDYNPDSSGSGGTTYIANSSSKVYHLSTCSYLPDASNRTYITNTAGYTPCGHCIGSSSSTKYIANTESKIYHLPTCSSLPTSNREEIYDTTGYTACKKCLG